MRVGWLIHQPPYVGGAELTAQEFKAAAPDGVEVVDMAPGEVGPADRYVCQNVPYHTLADLKATDGKPVTKFIHDAMPNMQEGTTDWLVENAALIFCSELHLRRFPHAIPEGAAVHVIPPALDLARFRPPRHIRRNGKREGVCSVAQWRNPGKGAVYLAEWAAEHGPVDIYGGGDFAPRSPQIRDMGALDPAKVAQTLWDYETFVFLPFQFEPFCRTVAEAQAAGCRVVTNGLVGAAEYLDKPEALETAAECFWEVVTDG